MPSPKKFARRLERVEKGLLAAQTQPRLPYSSIDGGVLTVNDPLTGNPQMYIGQQYDGAVTTISVGGDPLPSPSTPLVTPMAGGLNIYWDGTWVDESVTRSDFKRVTFHAVTDVDDFDAVDPAQICGEITTATGGEVFAALPVVEYFIFAVGWTDAGKFSVESDVAFGTPLIIVDQEAFDAVNDEIASLGASVATSPAVYREPTEPTPEPGRRAIWFDTANDNKISYYDGTSWTSAEFGPGALAAEAVVAETIAATALDGKTITGPLIQTVSTIARGIKIVGNNLVAYDAAGAGTFAIDGLTGGVSMVGPLISGGSITGPTIQTDPTANRGLKIVGNVMSAYDSNGVARFVANGSTGEVTVVGKLRTNTVGNKRVELGQNFADASAVEFFSGVSGELFPASLFTQVSSGSGAGANAYLALRGPVFTATDSPSFVYIGRTSSGRGTMTLSGQDIDTIGDNFRAGTTMMSGSTKYNAYLVNGGYAATLAVNTGNNIPSTGNMSLGQLRVQAQTRLMLDSTTDDVVITPASGKYAIVSGPLSVTGKLSVGGIDAVFAPAVTNHTGGVSCYRQGRVVTLVFNLAASYNTGMNDIHCVIPPGYRPPDTNYLWMVDGPTGGTVPIFVQADGAVGAVFGRTAGAGFVGSFTFIGNG